MTQEEFDQLVALGEMGGVEFKSTQPLSSPRPFKVIRAVLGLSNRRGGGHVLVGVAQDNDDLPRSVGMDGDDLRTWSEDYLVDVLGEYGEPRPQIRFDVFTDGNERRFVVVRVHEFEDQPVLCKKDAQGVLRRGALYLRPRGRAQTIENGSMEDMRSLLELATEKRLADIFATATRAGARIVHDQKNSERIGKGAAYEDELNGYVN